MKRAAFALLAVAALAGCGGSKPLKPAAPLPVVVVQAPSAGTWVRLLRATGWSARPGTSGELTSARTAAVVPADARLTSSEVSAVKIWVDEGGRLATANLALLKAFGVSREAPRTVAGVGGATWAKPLAVASLAAGGKDSVIGTQRQGRGLVVTLAFDPAVVGQGWEYLPAAPHQIGVDLGAPIGPRSNGARMFVDPGGLPPTVEYNPAKIADLLVRSGTRVAEIAAWNYDFNDPRQDYPYDRLIAALHARGILAYAWLEPPFVTYRLWQDHPECREKVESGRDAHVGWRRLIALESPACLGLAKESWERVLTTFSWDGVNLAELYFEPPYQGANGYTPFSASALAEFGGNPKTQVSAWLDFRTRLVTKLNADVLAFLSGLPGAKHLGLELTVIDDTLDRKLGRGVGSNVKALAAVAARDGATLIVEDPTTTWAKGPLRYDRLGPHVRTLMPPQAALLDVNVVKRYGAKPTSQMEGAELALTFESAAASFGTVGAYALGTMTEADRLALPGAMAGSTSTTDIGVYGPWTVTATAPSPTDNRLTVDGVQWPAADGTALVPGGNHILQWSKGAAAGPALLSFTGELGTARVASKRLTITYVARPDGLVVVSERPTSVTVDGAAIESPIVADPAGGYVVRVPVGTHRAVLGFG